MKKRIDPRVSTNTQMELTEPAPKNSNKWFRDGSLIHEEVFCKESSYQSAMMEALESYAEWRLRMIRLGCVLLVNTVKVGSNRLIIVGIASDTAKSHTPRFSFSRLLTLAKSPENDPCKEEDYHDSKSD